MKRNQVVALLTPVAAALAGAAAVWAGDNLGVDVDAGTLQELFIAGALIVIAPAAQWLHGWQKYEARQDELQRDLVLANAGVPAVTGAAEPFVPEDEDAEAIDDPSALEELDGLDDDLFDDEESAVAEV